MSAYGAKNQREIIKAVGRLDNFKIGHMKGAWYPSSHDVPPGMLSAGHIEALRHAGTGERPVYVVFSYSTPIAWRTAGDQDDQQWQSPGVWYSQTTTHHQSLARQGMDEWLKRQSTAARLIGS